LEISDNGIGMTRPDEVRVTSLGLTGMKARARSLQGEMRIRTAPGHGTTIEVTFPLQEAAYEEANSNLVG
jgi:signal transduction histidine kinase